jgi:outer membrane protein OmpA-like peptidoglycan-associated protein
MKRNFILLCYTVFSFAVLTVSAQEKGEFDREEKTFENDQKPLYWDNWFISGGVTGNLIFSEEDSQAPALMDRVVMGGEFSLGKWFNPNFGMRVQVIGGKLKGYNLINFGDGGLYTRPDNNTWEIFPRGVAGFQNIYDKAGLDDRLAQDPDHDPNRPKYLDHSVWDKGYTLDIRNDNVYGFFQEFNYVATSVDMMFNLSNLMRGYYSEKSLVDVSGFVGGGLIHAFDNKLTTTAYNGILAHLGGRLAINLNPHVAIYLESQVGLTFTEFDGFVGAAPVDALMNAAIGLQYTFNRRYNVPVVNGGSALSIDEINYLNEKINENRAKIEQHQDILDRQQDLLDRLNRSYEEDANSGKSEKIDRKGTPQTQIVSMRYLPEYIRFTLNSTQLQLTEEYKLKEAIVFLNANPDAKLLLVGYADRRTGTRDYNYELSRRRVETVSSELIRRGVDPNRLFLEWRGDEEQPYAPNDWNRIVIMVER